MRTERDEQDVTKELKDLLDRSAERLEPHVEARLRAIRRNALMPAEPVQRWVPFRRWATTGSFAAIAAVIGLSVWLTTDRDSLPMRAEDDVDIVAAQEPIEVYEDLEFYRWLAQKEQQGG